MKKFARHLALAALALAAPLAVLLPTAGSAVAGAASS